MKRRPNYYVYLKQRAPGKSTLGRLLKAPNPEDGNDENLVKWHSYISYRQNSLVFYVPGSIRMEGQMLTRRNKKG